MKELKTTLIGYFTFAQFVLIILQIQNVINIKWYLLIIPMIAWLAYTAILLALEFKIRRDNKNYFKKSKNK